MKHLQECGHAASHLRPALGPPSGILCGLCGQDVPTPIVLARLLSEAGALRQENATLRAALLRRTSSDECSRCGVIDTPERMFKGLRTNGYQCVCLPCLEAWFDDEAGDCADMHIKTLARYLERMDASVGTGHHGSLALKAHQAFPELAGVMRRMML